MYIFKQKITFKKRHRQSGGYLVITKLNTFPTTGMSASKNLLKIFIFVKIIIYIFTSFAVGKRVLGENQEISKYNEVANK